MLKKVLLMNRSAARHAVWNARVTTTLVEMAALVKCMMQYAQVVESRARFLSSRAMTALCIAAIVLEDRCEFKGVFFREHAFLMLIK